MQKKADTLGVQGCYKEAKTLRKKVKAMMQYEQDQHMGETRKGLFLKSNKMMERHQKELANI